MTAKKRPAKKAPAKKTAPKPQAKAEKSETKPQEHTADQASVFGDAVFGDTAFGSPVETPEGVAPDEAAPTNGIMTSMCNGMTLDDRLDRAHELAPIFTETLADMGEQWLADQHAPDYPPEDLIKSLFLVGGEQ